MKNISMIRILLFIGFILPIYGQKTLAVLDFQPNGVNSHEARIISDEIRNIIINNEKYTVLERGVVDEILKEQGLQQSGVCSTNECIVEAGKLLGVQFILAGSLGKFGNIYLINARIINIENSKIISTANFKNEGDIESILIDGVKQIAIQLNIISDFSKSSSLETTKEALKDSFNFKTLEYFDNGNPKKILRTRIDIDGKESISGYTYFDSLNKVERFDNFENGLVTFYKYDWAKEAQSIHIGKLVNGQKDGLWNFRNNFYQTDISLNFKNGIENGFMVAHHYDKLSGEIKEPIMAGFFNNGLRDSAWTYWGTNNRVLAEYSNGLITELTFRSRIGDTELKPYLYISIGFHDSTTKWEEGYIKNVHISFSDYLVEDGEGKFTDYYSNGNKYIEGIVENGELIQYSYYSSEGFLEYKYEEKDSLLIEELYYSTGRLYEKKIKKKLMTNFVNEYILETRGFYPDGTIQNYSINEYKEDPIRKDTLDFYSYIYFDENGDSLFLIEEIYPFDYIRVYLENGEIYEGSMSNDSINCINGQTFFFPWNKIGTFNYVLQCDDSTDYYVYNKAIEIQKIGEIYPYIRYPSEEKNSWRSKFNRNIYSKYIFEPMYTRLKGKKNGK